MSLANNLVAAFSQDVGQFAFHSGSTQKNSIDIYPLDASNNYKINSSLVNNVDYENHDLKASDILYVGWCSDIDENNQNGGRTKRKLDNDEEIKKSRTENFFVNVFKDGQIVTFSTTGKDIINIFRNKDEIRAVDTSDRYIWTYDSDDCVKKLEYNKTKPVKTFHLIDGKGEEITHFQVLKYQGKNANEDGIFLALVTEQKVYVVDPSKRRPTTIATFEIFGALSCTFSDDGKHFSIATIDTLTVYDFDTKEVIQSWDIQTERIGTVRDLIFALTVDGKISVFKITESEPVSTIIATNSEVIDFKQIDNDVMIAWLNVNEPNFKLLSVDNIRGNKEIILNEGVETIEHNTDHQVEEKLEEKFSGDVETTEEKKEEAKKLSKSEQTGLNVRLVKALSRDQDQSDNMSVMSLLSSQSWNQERIISFVDTQLVTDSLVGSVLNKVVAALEQDVWTENDTLRLWLKWIMLLKNVPNSTMHDRKPKKHMKHLKNSLKASNESLPILLGIQGRLDLLNKQAELREEFSMLAVDETAENVAIDQGDNFNNIETTETTEKNDEDNMVYVNGENDVFVDANDFTTVSEN